MSYPQRIQRVQNLLRQKNLDALFVENSINIFYLTGIDASWGRVLISQHEAHLIVDNRYYEKAKKNSKIPVLLANEYPLPKLFETIYSNVKTLAFESDNTTYNLFKELENSLPKINLVAIDQPIKTLRSIKEPQEIDLLKNAAELCMQGYDHVVRILKEGISEEDVAMELEIFWRKRRGKKVSFDPIIAFGKNSSMPHYRAGTARLRKGDPVLIDIGVNLEHYHSDMTRIIFFGQPEEKILNVYHVVLEAQKKALDACKPGITAGLLDKIARDHITSKGFGDYFTHSLGHGVGLEIHEAPTLRSAAPQDKVVLEAGMVITIEPGIYLPDYGGIRIEDTIVITDIGYMNLINRSKDVRTIHNV